MGECAGAGMLAAGQLTQPCWSGTARLCGNCLLQQHTQQPLSPHPYCCCKPTVTDLHADIWRRHVTIAAVTPSGGSCSWLKLLLLLTLPPRVLTTAVSPAAVLLPPPPVLLLLLNWLRSCARQGKLSRACTGRDNTTARRMCAAPVMGANRRTGTSRQPSRLHKPSQLLAGTVCGSAEQAQQQLPPSTRMHAHNKHSHTCRMALR
jgi:hypothetical protein